MNRMTTWLGGAAAGFFVLASPVDAASITDARNSADGVTITLNNVTVVNTVDLISSGSSKSITLQDGTGALQGITLFGTNALVDEVLTAAGSGNLLSSLSGTVGSFNGLKQIQIGTASSFSPVSSGSNNSFPLVSVSPSDFANSSPTAEGLESLKVKLDGFQFPTPGGAFALGNYVDSNTGVTARVSTNDIATALNTQFSNAIPAGPVDLVGVFSQYDNSSPFDGGYQLLITEIIVPEPASLGLLMIGGLALARRRA